MATGSNRDTKLTLRVEALGDEEIKKVENGLRDLAAQGGASAAEFEKLADEISKLGDQNAALQAFTALADGADDLRTKQDAAATVVQEMAARLDTLRRSTDEARAAQQQATAELNQGRVRYAEAGNAIRELKAEYDAAGRESDEYRTSLQALVREQGESEVANIALRQAQIDSNKALSEAVAAQKTLETQYTRAEKGVTRAAEATEQHAAKMRDAAAAAEQMGVDTSDLASAEGKLFDALLQGAQAAERKSAAVSEAAEADRLAAIEAKTFAELTRRGAEALQAEELALRDAARTVREYEAAKAKATADAQAWQKEADAIVDAAEAAKRLEQENLSLAAAAVEAAAAQKRFNDELAQQKAREQADYVRSLEQAFDALEAQEKAVVAETQRVKAAFDAIGTRSLEEVEREIEDVRAAMVTVANSGKATGAALNQAFASGEARIKSLQRETRELTGSLTLADKAATLFKNSMGQIAAGNLIADGIGMLVEKVKEMGREFIATTVETEQLRKALNAIYKDSTTAGAQFQYLRNAANAAGISVGQMSQAFVQFSASANAANIPISVSNDLFMSVSRTAGTLGLSADATSGALNALGQMAAKGVVSLEELRQQLGDRMPGALSAAAKGLGLTEAELIKLVESGSLAARDFFPAFAQGLKDMHGSTEGLIPTWNRFKNLLTETAQGVGDAGGLRVMTVALRGLVAVLGVIVVPLYALVQAFGTLVNAIGAVAGAIATFTNPFQALKDVVVAGWKNIADLAGGFARLAAGMDSAGDSAQRNAANVKIGADAARDATVASEGLTRSQQAQKIAAEIAGKAQMDVGARLVQTNAALDQLVGAQQKETEALAKSAKATKEYGDTLVALAQQGGNQVEMLAASEAAANSYAAATARVAASQREELVLMEQKLTALVSAREAQGLNADQIAKETVELNKKITTLRAEVEQTDASAEAARKDVLVRKLASEAYADNSGKVAEYTAALAKARAESTLANQLVEVGAISKADAAAATERLTVAQARLNDALADSVTKQRAANTEAASRNNLIEQQLNLDMAEARAAEAKAIRLGNEYEAQQAVIRQREIEIKLIEARIASIEAEAKGAIALANAELSVLEAKGELDPIARVNIENSIRSAEAKMLEAKALGASVAELQEELRLLRLVSGERDKDTKSTRDGTVARGASSDAIRKHSDEMERMLMQYKLSADYTERQIELLEREADAAERAAEAKRKYWNVDKDGFTKDNEGNRMQMSMPYERYVLDTAMGQGLSEKEAVTLMNRYFVNGRGVGTKKGMDWFSTVNQAVSDQVVQNARRSASQPNTPGTDTAGRTGTGTSTNKTVTINVGGKSQTVQVASDTDVNNLTSILRELERAAGTSA